MVAQIEQVLNTFGSAWKLCRNPSGKYEVEVFFHGDNGWSRCGEYDTVMEAVQSAYKYSLTVTNPIDEVLSVLKDRANELTLVSTI